MKVLLSWDDVKNRIPDMVPHPVNHLPKFLLRHGGSFDLLFHNPPLLPVLSFPRLNIPPVKKKELFAALQENRKVLFAVPKGVAPAVFVHMQALSASAWIQIPSFPLTGLSFFRFLLPMQYFLTAVPALFGQHTAMPARKFSPTKPFEPY